VRRTSGPQITARDREILGWISRHGVVTSNQVARRFFARGDSVVGERAAYRRLTVLIAMGLVRRDAVPYWRHPHVLRVTTAGSEEGETFVRPARLVQRDIAHSIAVVDLVEQLLADTPGASLRTEREIRADRWHDRDQGRRQPGRGRVPDAELTLPSGRIVAVELDLTPKRAKDYERILLAYKQERYDQVWWYIRAITATRVRKLVADNRADDFITVIDWMLPASGPPAKPLVGG